VLSQVGLDASDSTRSGFRAVALLLVALATGCGGDAEGSGSDEPKRQPVVNTQGIPADLVAYRVGGDGRRLDVVFSRTSGEELERAVVREHENEVLVAVGLRRFGGMQDLRFDCVSVRLGWPLEDRQGRSRRQGKRMTPLVELDPGFRRARCRPAPSGSAATPAPSAAEGP